LILTNDRSSIVVVVFPLLPVIPIVIALVNGCANSISEITGIPFSKAFLLLELYQEFQDFSLLHRHSEFHFLYAFLLPI
jgi:hypothetical protein